MLVSLSWLEKFVDITVSTPVLIEDLTMTGLNVEHATSRGFSDPNVVVGRVLEVGRHPNADKLSLCRVEVESGEAREIVCGAPNVASGQLVLVALPGARLPNGTRIRRSKIRGVASDGMICSEIELGVGSDASGIMVLENTFPPGTPAEAVLPAPDTILEIEVTPNRPDLLSHLGVAREIAAIYNVALRAPNTSDEDDGESMPPDFAVDIEAPADCARYVGKRVSGIRVGPSPKWLSSAIESVGLHSVNNVVDATNYVMMELGQPLHAFDYRKIRGSEIIVRRAQSGDRLAALDGKTYELDSNILVIADAAGPTALAGIIGGEASAVNDDTEEILVESACFEPTLVRKGRRQLAIHTDASYRFERGVDREFCRVAAERAAERIVEVAGGKAGAIIDVYAARRSTKPLVIRKQAASRLLGVNLMTEEIATLLDRLSFDVVSRTDDDVTTRVPSHRADVVEEVDLIEEVARLHGYNRIGTGWAYRSTTVGEREALDVQLSRLSAHLTGRGFTEALTSSFSDGRELDDFEWDENDPRRRPVPVRNPLNAIHRYLRTSLVPGMLDAVRRNMDHDVRDIRMYQIGKVFLSEPGGEQLPQEQMSLGLVMTRPDAQNFWYNLKESFQLFDLKKEIEMILRLFRIDSGSGVDYNFDGSSGRFSYVISGRTVVEGGIIPEAVGERYDFDQPVWCASLEVDELYRHAAPDPKFKPLAEYPSSKRDLSLVARRGVHFADIEKSLVKSGGPLLESLQVFDVYTGENIGEDHTAYGVRLNFRSTERTLTDADVDPVIEKMVANLKKQHGVELRS